MDLMRRKKLTHGALALHVRYATVSEDNAASYFRICELFSVAYIYAPHMQQPKFQNKFMASSSTFVCLYQLYYINYLLF